VRDHSGVIRDRDHVPAVEVEQGEKNDAGRRDETAAGLGHEVAEAGDA
jgi:hypothetical protein